MNRALIRLIGILVVLGVTESTSQTRQSLSNADELLQFVTDRGIVTIDEMLRQLPDYIVESSVLLGRSRSLHRASEQYPRAVLYGPDGRFFIAISSTPDDPRYNMVETARMNGDTGIFEYRTLDFRGETPTLDANETVCRGCHGNPPRPIWFSYAGGGSPLDLVFGYDFMLTDDQYQTIVRIQQDSSERFHPLPFSLTHTDGWRLSLTNHRFASPKIVMASHLALSVAWGLFVRAKQSPFYPSTKYDLLYQSWCLHGAQSYPVPDLYERLGLEALNDFQLQFTYPEALANGDFHNIRSWVNQEGGGNLDDTIAFLILDDIQSTDPAMAEILAPVEPLRKRWVTEQFEILGEARRDFLRDNEFHLPNYFTPFYDFLYPVRSQFCSYLNDSR